MTRPLGDEIKAMIAAEGPMSVERYMTLCLQHPKLGYYTTRETIGRSGDFITAPEVSQMFGELLGLWAVAVWMGFGGPPAMRLVELGPGRGTLMADALRATRIVPRFHDAISIALVETSPRLEAMQRETLEGAARQVEWFRTPADVPDGPAIVIANEFFDALPVRHYLRGERGWHERVVGLSTDGSLQFGAAREPIDIAATAGAPGQILEVNHAAIATMGALATRIAMQGGALLVLDYGHAETALGETLQALRGHAYADPLATPGEADLTTHVDFAALARAAGAAGARTHGPLAQGVFLERLGIKARADALTRRANERQTDDHQAADIETALARLTSSDSTMATLFKVLCVAGADAPTPPGFEEMS